MLCYVMLCYVVLCYDMSCDVILCYFVIRDVLMYHFMVCRNTLCNVIRIVSIVVITTHIIFIIKTIRNMFLKLETSKSNKIELDHENLFALPHLQHCRRRL